MKSFQPTITLEDLTNDQFTYIHNLYEYEYRQLFKSWKNTCLMILIVILLLTTIIFIVNELNPVDPELQENIENLSRGDIIQMGVISLMVIWLFTSLAFYIAYIKNLKKLKKDTIHKQKIVECTRIIEKKLISHNSTYFFTLLSSNLLNMEVDETDFHNYRVGDEINIEYTHFSKISIGYH